MHRTKSTSHSFILTDQGEQRKLEEVRAARVLGMEIPQFGFFTDGEFAEDDVDTAVNFILERIMGKQFDNIVSFDGPGYTGHPDHMTAATVAEKLFHILPSVKHLTLRSMSDEERVLWEPYFIPIPPQEHIPAVNLNIESVMQYKRSAILQYDSQLEIDGYNHLRRLQRMRPFERYRILNKGNYQEAA